MKDEYTKWLRAFKKEINNPNWTHEKLYNIIGGEYYHKLNDRLTIVVDTDVYVACIFLNIIDTDNGDYSTKIESNYIDLDELPKNTKSLIKYCKSLIKEHIKEKRREFEYLDYLEKVKIL